MHSEEIRPCVVFASGVRIFLGFPAAIFCSPVRFLGNNLGTPGLVSIVNSLSMNSTLRLLDVSCNDLGGNGAILAALLAENSSLQKLSFECNELDRDGASLIFESLENNTSLTALDLARECFLYFFLYIFAHFAS